MEKTIEAKPKVPPPKPLYALQSYSDNNSVTILGFYPVDWNGIPDDSRSPCFRGQVMIKHSHNGQLVPYNFNYPDDCITLIDAVNRWSEMVEKGFVELQSNLVREALLNGGVRAQ